MEVEKRPIGRPIVWDEQKKEKAFESIVDRITNGESLRQIIYDADRDTFPTFNLFFKWLSESKDLAYRYAQACEVRSELIFDEMFDIADDSTKDIQEIELPDGRFVDKVDYEHIQRSKLRIDTRKWALSKMNPKKYSDKVDITTNQESINKPVDQKEILDNITNILNGGSIPKSGE